MRRFFTTENTESTEKTLVKLGSSCCGHSRLDSSFPYFRQKLFTTKDTEGTEKKPEEIFSVFSVVNAFLGRDVRREWQPCS